jgi:hypothetical protein
MEQLQSTSDVGGSTTSSRMFPQWHVPDSMKRFSLDVEKTLNVQALGSPRPCRAHDASKPGASGRS